MAAKIYIFIFLLAFSGSIKSKAGNTSLNELVTNIPESSHRPNQESANRFAGNTYQENRLRAQAFQVSVGEIVINEIMADPTPVVGLPGREYLELYNGRSTAVSLKGWSLGLGSKLKPFPDVTVSPGGYLLVTATGGAKDLQQFGKVVEISGFLVNNDGLTISLYDPGNRLTDQVEYLPSLHKKGFENGGYSLERIDPERLCGQRYNWATTLSPLGGTPGGENSVRATNPDNTPPQVLSTFFKDNSRLEVQISESVKLPVSLSDFLKNIPAGIVVDSVRTDRSNGLLQICFRASTIQNGSSYSLTLHGLADECGNIMPDKLLKFGYYLPLKSDLLISEVLFNPFPNGSDFVEIYNNSPHEVDLSGLYLATRDGSKSLKQISQVAADQRYMPSGSFLAATRSRSGVLNFYKSKCEDCIVQTGKFPTLNDLAGVVVLLDKNLQVIDEMEYSEAMHHPLISNTEGISLERISFSGPASRKENWHSAAKSVGFATPGYRNSAVEVGDSIKNGVTIDPQIFSPNGDGINDQLNIYINTGVPGWILNITILNCAGRVVRKLVNNYTTGASDLVVWDGLGADYQKVQPGIYMLDISLFDISGKSRRSRQACVITDKL